jgi:2-polyprenyl-3-methyl-5-hydroxy-6-metoxy-1,4-benzoquinol methylase
MFSRLVWQQDRMLLDDLVFRLQHFKSGEWDVPEYFVFYKTKVLVDQYEYYFSKNPAFKPNNIMELGIFEGGSTVFWYEAFQPNKLVAIDLLDREDSPYFQKYVEEHELFKKISTFWRVDQADKPKLREIVASEFIGPLDLVIDDCSHLYAPTLASFETLFPLLAPRGIYIIEDWAWGHWPEYIRPDHEWANEEPLTSLVIKFIEATGTSLRLINSITILQGFVAIERNDEKIENPANFSLEDYIVRRPSKPFLKPQELISSTKNRSSSSVDHRPWLKRVFPEGTFRRRIYERIKKSSFAILRIRGREDLKRKFDDLSLRRAQSEQEINSKNKNTWSMFKEELSAIDAKIGSAQSLDIPRLFSGIPLEVFGKLSLEVPPQYPNIKAFLPSMASEAVQMHWTGAHGEVLLGQSLAFIKTMISGYAAITGKKITDASILDFGCGWGRLIRPLYKFIPYEHIYGVDPWDESIKECEKHHIKANLAISELVPRSLPFERQFDLIFAFSVFTHLSEKTATVALNTLRKYILDDGLLVITIRPKEYWYIPSEGALAAKMIKIHEEKGFAFNPLSTVPVDGDITYGDASMSLDYFKRHFPQWKIESVECNDVDVHQVILFLRPV